MYFLPCRLAVDVTRAPEVVTSSSKPSGPSTVRATPAGTSAVHTPPVSPLMPHAGARSLSTATTAAASAALASPASAPGSGVGGRRVYGGTFDCLRSTYQLEGVRGVYSGFGVSLAGATPVFCEHALICRYTLNSA
jgi:hypothetical protein